eukprot:CAMPEP_0171179002 /NCGR_PEP_ID=MMETSP0790-20130122/13035_1 /TAXON_ID=2925 /ORGANISM="Alexandrium catenella, Strain OF101" /LENGTH=264 /DNA_ID=CAMNT_0011643927 /DNA_START=178 /DNA_END=972 /DNA_ORIENTATION=-
MQVCDTRMGAHRRRHCHANPRGMQERGIGSRMGDTLMPRAAVASGDRLPPVLLDNRDVGAPVLPHDHEQHHHADDHHRERNYEYGQCLVMLEDVRGGGDDEEEQAHPHGVAGHHAHVPEVHRHRINLLAQGCACVLVGKSRVDPRALHRVEVVQDGKGHREQARGGAHRHRHDEHALLDRVLLVPLQFQDRRDAHAEDQRGDEPQAGRGVGAARVMVQPRLAVVLGVRGGHGLVGALLCHRPELPRAAARCSGSARQGTRAADS